MKVRTVKDLFTLAGLFKTRSEIEGKWSWEARSLLMSMLNLTGAKSIYTLPFACSFRRFACYYHHLAILPFPDQGLKKQLISIKVCELVFRYAILTHRSMTPYLPGTTTWFSDLTKGHDCIASCFSGLSKTTSFFLIWTDVNQRPSILCQELINCIKFNSSKLIIKVKE